MCLKEFEKHNLQVERVSAVDGKSLIGLHTRIKPAEYGCALSHKNILCKIVSENLSKVLILEDDVEFVEDLNLRFEEAIKRVPNGWDMLYLGGNQVIKAERINELVSRNSRTFTTSHYGITLKAAKEMLQYIKLDTQIDIEYSRRQHMMQSYLFTPPLAWQLPGYSDIQEGDTNYDFMK